MSDVTPNPSGPDPFPRPILGSIPVFGLPPVTPADMLGDTFPPDPNGLSFGGRQFPSPIASVRVFGDVVVLRLDDDARPEQWAEIRIRPGRLVEWLTQMGYEVREKM